MLPDMATVANVVGNPGADRTCWPAAVKNFVCSISLKDFLEILHTSGTGRYLESVKMATQEKVMLSLPEMVALLQLEDPGELAEGA